MDNYIYKDFIEFYKEAEMVVIGMGAQVHRKQFSDQNQMNELLNFFNQYLDKKNYFIITSHQNNLFEKSSMNPKRIVNPLMIGNLVQGQPKMESNIQNEEKQWDLYNKWLAATLNHRLMLIELGEDFNHPNLFRWPFEKVTYINRKSKMIRIHDTFFQLPENIQERAVGIPVNAMQFIKELKAFVEECC